MERKKNEESKEMKEERGKKKIKISKEQVLRSKDDPTKKEQSR